ncbi:MAG: hypothetical protein QM681_02585 [Novosphingobium sp.]
MPHPPVFIAFTGADDPALLPAMTSLSHRYPIEWGMLLDPAQEGSALFPGTKARTALLGTPGLRWAAHVCGEQARLIADTPGSATIPLHGFTRVQVNHGFTGSNERQVENTVQFGRSRGLRAMLQCLGDFPEDPRLDWLFDVSFGRGNRPDTWPALKSRAAFCGYSGGIGPANAAETVAALAVPEGTPYWIDMESGVRTNGKFDLAKCEAVCRAVYG